MNVARKPPCKVALEKGEDRGQIGTVRGYQDTSVCFPDGGEISNRKVSSHLKLRDPFAAGWMETK
jgi:hypothetical protein